MIETENKVYARRCESHVEALRRAVPGCIEKVEWQCEDQLTITVKQDKLPNILFYLVNDNLIFNYATEYCLKHPTIPAPKDFKITDAD